jgi:predicted DNA-binding ArsR family transcriptional regulator
MKYINIDNSKIEFLHYQSNKEMKESNDGKGWGFTNVYSLKDLRDIYLIIKENKFDSIGELLDKVNKTLKSEDTWEVRRLQEPLNALRNFNYVAQSKISVSKIAFESSTIGSELSGKDIAEFTSIFFSYSRFRELILWFLPSNTQLNFIEDTIELKESKILFAFSRISRFTDTIIYDLESNCTLYSLEKPDNMIMSSQMYRFWDVFSAWGRSLNLLEKVNMRYFDYSITSNNFKKEKKFNCYYFRNKNSINLNLLEYIDEHFKSKYIFIPELVLHIALKFRYGINEINNYLIEEYLKNKSKFSFERTSEIFIKGSNEELLEKDSIPYPYYRNSYISHITIR